MLGYEVLIKMSAESFKNTYEKTPKNKFLEQIMLMILLTS